MTMVNLVYVSVWAMLIIIAADARKPYPHGAKCPPLKPGTVGICIDQCSPDDSRCPEGQLCCSNGCGRVCTDPDRPGRPQHGESGSGPNSRSNSGSNEATTTTAANNSGCAAVLCEQCKTCLTTKSGKGICVDSGACSCKGPLVQCFVDPCQVSTCANHPDATCVSKYCDGCNAFFFDDSGNRINDCTKPAAA